MASVCVAKSAVFASAARPNQGKATGAKPARASKLWTPKSSAVDSPMIIVEGDSESKMAGLTAKRREVIMDMEDFAENEVRARAPPPISRAARVHAASAHRVCFCHPQGTCPASPRGVARARRARGAFPRARNRARVAVLARIRLARRTARATVFAGSETPVPAPPAPVLQDTATSFARRARSQPPPRFFDFVFFPPFSRFPPPQLMDLLKDTSKNWQPQDFLPDPESPDFLDEVSEIQKRTAGIPDEHLVVLVGDMITEEALPTYMNMLNTLEGTKDTTGADATAWARWTRKWTAEENRHGDLMNKYLWMSGKVSLKPIETTIQNLIGSGMNPKTENNPYLGFVYTSFQERATKISHGNTARFAKEHGDETLAKICGIIAADEGRHEIAYQRIIDEVMKRDQDGAVLAFADMMKKQIVMPAHLMDDGEHRARTGRDLFSDFATVAEATGTYTAEDYASIMEHLIKRWNIADVNCESGEAAEAQEFLMKQPARIRKLAAFGKRKKEKTPPVKESFSWIFGRQVEGYFS